MLQLIRCLTTVCCLFAVCCLLFDNWDKLDWHCLTMFDDVWHCLTLFDTVWRCLTMFDTVWHCLTLFDDVLYLWIQTTRKGTSTSICDWVKPTHGRLRTWSLKHEHTNTGNFSLHMYFEFKDTGTGYTHGTPVSCVDHVNAPHQHYFLRSSPAIKSLMSASVTNAPSPLSLRMEASFVFNALLKFW